MIYFIEAVGLDRVKIGMVGSDVAMLARLDAFAVASPVPTNLLGVTDGMRAEEIALHTRFAEHRSHGEWFYLWPIREDVLALARPWASGVVCATCGVPVSLKTFKRAARDRRVLACREHVDRKNSIDKHPDLVCKGGCGRTRRPQKNWTVAERAAWRCRGCAMREAWKVPAYGERREASRLAALRRTGRTYPGQTVGSLPRPSGADSESQTAFPDLADLEIGGAA